MTFDPLSALRAVRSPAGDALDAFEVAALLAIILRADAFLGSFGRPDDGAREAAIEVLSTAGLDIAKAEQEALDAFRAVPLERRLADLETELAELRRALG